MKLSRPGHRRGTVGTVIRLIPSVFALLFPVWASAQMGQVPQVPAFLPTVDQVAASQAMPLDGTWLVNTIRKKIRIEAGRAYAVDGWTHLFVLNIQPGMVVIRDVVPSGPGAYAAEDLPLMGKWTAKVQPDRSLAVTVAGTLGPASYKLIPVQIDNPQWSRRFAMLGTDSVQRKKPVSPPNNAWTSSLPLLNRVLQLSLTT